MREGCEDCPLLGLIALDTLVVGYARSKESLKGVRVRDQDSLARPVKDHEDTLGHTSIDVIFPTWPPRSAVLVVKL